MTTFRSLQAFKLQTLMCSYDISVCTMSHDFSYRKIYCREISFGLHYE